MPSRLKFVFFKKAKKSTKSSPSIWHLLHNVKSRVKILSIFVAFLENMNFTMQKEAFGKNLPIQKTLEHWFGDNSM